MANVTVNVQMRWADIDALGHVHNAAYLHYFELARAELVLSVLEKPHDGAVNLVVRRHEIDYRRSLFYRPEPVAVDSEITGVGRTSMTLSGAVREAPGGDVYASIVTVLVAIDATTGATMAIPDWLRTALLAPTEANDA